MFFEIWFSFFFFFGRVIFAESFLPPGKKKYLSKMSQPTNPTWNVRSPVKQGFFFSWPFRWIMKSTSKYSNCHPRSHSFCITLLNFKDMNECQSSRYLRITILWNNSGYLELLFLMATVLHLIQNALSGQVIFWFSDPWQWWIVTWRDKKKQQQHCSLNFSNFFVYYRTPWLNFSIQCKNKTFTKSIQVFNDLRHWWIAALLRIHTLLLNFLFSDWLVRKYAECIENV